MILTVGPAYWLLLFNAHFLFDRPVPLWMWIISVIVAVIDAYWERSINEEK